MERGPRGKAVAQTSRHLPPTGIPDTPHGRSSNRTSFLVQSAFGLRPTRSRGGNGRSERSERSTDQQRAERPKRPRLSESMSTHPRASDNGRNWGRESRQFHFCSLRALLSASRSSPRAEGRLRPPAPAWRPIAVGPQHLRVRGPRQCQ
ncbi:hypothetical protein NDU88_013169 [Pleurodeles waltl]|uniref:Uncharacterized protein n=1 Tax=Pleurodeles waltl TaxID=8319 RepID=A0AAV7R4V2_PLEWA|nr:hypothetical protein NDU88_013169 [Pleurodeles waltl]